MRRPVSLLSLALALAGALAACQGDGPDDDGPDTPARVNGPISDWPTRADAGLGTSDPAVPPPGSHEPGMPGGSGPSPGSAGGTGGGGFAGGGTVGGGTVGGSTAGGGPGGLLGGVVTPPMGSPGGGAGTMDAATPLPSVDAGVDGDAGQADAAPEASSDGPLHPG